MQKIYNIHDGTGEGTLTPLEVGSKAFHLMRLVDCGYGDHILPGFAVQGADPHGVVLEDRLVALFEDLCKHSGEVIVRSNHAQEGTGKYSFAGVFDSVEHVTTITQLREAFEQISASAHQGMVKEYCAMNELSDFNPAMMRYLVQPQIIPDVFAMFHNAGNVGNPQKDFRISFRAEGKECRLVFIHSLDSLFTYQKISGAPCLYFEHLRKEAEKIFGDTFSDVERKVERIARLAKRIEEQFPLETMEFEFGVINTKTYIFQRTPVHIDVPYLDQREVPVKPKYSTLVEARYVYNALNRSMVVEEEAVPLVVINVPDGTKLNGQDIDREILQKYIDGLEDKIKNAHHCVVVMTREGEYIINDYAESFQKYAPYVFNKLIQNAKYVISWYSLFGLRHELMHILERGQQLIEVNGSCDLNIFSKEPYLFEGAITQPFTRDWRFYADKRYQIERFPMDKPFDRYPEYVKITSLGDDVFIVPISTRVKT